MGLRTDPESLLFPPIKMNRAALAEEQRRRMNNGSELKIKISAPLSGKMSMGAVQTKTYNAKSL